MREKLSSRLGFILLSAGCAIGMGNVWRFPYVTGQSGGGFFVLIYLAFLALLGIPVLTMEFASGRASGCSLAMQHAALTPGRRFWRIHGVVGLVGCVMLMMFYTTVVGWTVLYGFRTAGGWEKFRAEANCGEGLKVPSFLRFHCAYVVPTMIVVIFVLGVICRFR